MNRHGSTTHNATPSGLHPKRHVVTVAFAAPPGLINAYTRRLWNQFAIVSTELSSYCRPTN